MEKQKEIAKSRNQLLVSRRTAEQDTEIASFEIHYYSYENPELKKGEPMKQRKLALEKASIERSSIR
jgi:hypothetical protein